MRAPILRATLGTLIVCAAAGAQSDSLRSTKLGPAIRKISTAAALSTEQLGNVAAVRALPSGRVLVNDGTRRRLLLMDSSLKTVGVVLDSLTEVSNAYGVRQGALIAYRGDSTLFLDPASFALLVLDQGGRIARVRSVPRVRDVNWITSTSYGWPGIDAKGRLVFRIPAEVGPPLVAPPKGVPWFPQDPDSAFVVGIDFDTRKVDTLGSVRVPKEPFTVKQNGFGFSYNSLTNPMPTADDWAVLADGSVAFLRWRDYRIDYLNPDGTRSSSPKLPFDWQRMTDDDKQRLTDSVANVQRRSAMTSYFASMIRWVNMYNQQYPKDFKVDSTFRPSSGYMRGWRFPPGLKFPDNYVYGCAPNEEAKQLPNGTPTCIPQPVTIPGNLPNAPTVREAGVMAWTDLPDYRPPFASGAARADMDGNLWIKTTPAKPVPGGPVYDVVNRKGELFDRIQLPPGYSLVGFGPGRVVFLTMRDASGLHLARVVLR